MKDIKIKIHSEDHSRKVQDHLFSLGYERKVGRNRYFPSNIDIITAYEKEDGKKYIYGVHKGSFGAYTNQEVELVTEVTDGKVCTYLKEVEPPLKKWKFEVRTSVFGNLVLGAVDVDSGELIANFINLNTMSICGYSKNILEEKYDISGYEWNDDGSIKIN